MLFIDSHAHLTSKIISKNIGKLIKDLSKHELTKVITIGCTIKDAINSIKLTKQYPNKIYAGIGLYPHDDNENSLLIRVNRNQKDYEDRLFEQLKQLVMHNLKKVVGIGECGLDYTTPPPWEIIRTKQNQQILFEKQIELAKSIKKPIIIHSRNAKEDTISIIKNNYKKGSTNNGVWHCFSEDLETAQTAIDYGFYISFSGLITYKSTKELQDIAKILLLEKILIETDSPYLVPNDARNLGVKYNKPQYVKIIGQKIADLKGISIERVAIETRSNTENLFKI